MARQSILRMANIKPLTPAGAYVPAPRVKSMTEVVSKEDGRKWDIAAGAANGSRVDASTLRASGERNGYVSTDGWVQRSTPLLLPGSDMGG